MVLKKYSWSGAQRLLWAVLRVHVVPGLKTYASHIALELFQPLFVLFLFVCFAPQPVVFRLLPLDLSSEISPGKLQESYENLGN